MLPEHPSSQLPSSQPRYVSPTLVSSVSFNGVTGKIDYSRKWQIEKIRESKSDKSSLELQNEFGL